MYGVDGCCSFIILKIGMDEFFFLSALSTASMSFQISRFILALWNCNNSSPWGFIHGQIYVLMVRDTPDPTPISVDVQIRRVDVHLFFVDRLFIWEVENLHGGIRSHKIS